MTTSLFAFLLITDFSGSMLQKMDGKVKIDLLKEQVQTLAESLPSGKKVKIFSFGSKQHELCSQLKSQESLNEEITAKINSLSPGAYGKTPLAQALQQSLQTAKKTKTSDLLVLTDGADTCGQDPCKVLLEQDKQLDFKSKVRLMIIGYDLQSDRKKLECLDEITPRLQHIDLIYKNSSNLQASHQALKKFAESLTQNALNSSKEGKLSILGAPDFVEFTAQTNIPKENSRKWHGDFPILLPQGNYEIRNLTKNSKPLSVIIRPGENQQIRWSQTLAWTRVAIEHIPQGFEVQALASPQVVQGFGITAEKKLNSPDKFYLEIGPWSLETTHPWWLQGVRLPLIVPLEDPKPLSLQSFFLKNYLWLDPPQSSKSEILQLFQEEQEVRILVEPTSKPIPIPQGWLFQYMKEPTSISSPE